MLRLEKLHHRGSPLLTTTSRRRRLCRPLGLALLLGSLTAHTHGALAAAMTAKPLQSVSAEPVASSSLPHNSQHIGHSTNSASHSSAPASRKSRFSLEQKLRDDRKMLVEEEKKRLDLMQAALKSTPVEAAQPQQPPEDVTTTQLREQLAAKQLRLIQLQASYTDLYPEVITVREEIADLQAQLEKAQGSLRSRPRSANAAPMTLVERDRELSQINAIIEQREAEIADGQRSDLQPSREVRPLRATPAQATPAQIPPAALPDPVRISPPDGAATVPTSNPGLQTPRRPDLQSSAVHAHGWMPPILGWFLAMAGLVLGSVFLVWRRRQRSRFIHTGVALRAMLLKDVDYIGSIPRMRHR